MVLRSEAEECHPNGLAYREETAVADYSLIMHCCQEYFIVSPLVYSKIPFEYYHQDTTQHDNTHSDI